MFKGMISITIAMTLSFSSINALTLEESVIEAMSTNPVVQERLKNYRATQQDLNVAESEYYPQLDLRASVGYTEQGNLKNDTDNWNHNVADNSYGMYESSLTLTQNIFDGFGTTHKVDYQEARILAAAYNYIEKSNDIAFKMTNAYLNVLRSYELLQTAKENVQINEDILRKVRDLLDAGLTTDSEVKKIESALSLSRSNLIVQKNNAQDTEYNFRRILGRMPNVAELEKPVMDTPMPESIERAALYAINHNPSLLVSRYNIEGAQALRKQHQKEFYPKIDLEVSQTYNDYEKGVGTLDIADDRFKARIVMSYNLFRGGADKATVQKDVSTINQEVEIKRDLKRQVIEGMDLSWNAYTMIGLQLEDLKDYNKFSEKTLELYKEEYDLGRRSLLDLLSAQNDVINSRSQIITAEYDRLFAQYRILDAMGLLPLAVAGDTKEFTAKVNLYSDDEALEVLDEIPVRLDVDNDNIFDNQDLCDNSLLENNIMPYGCKKMRRDSDGDGVIDDKDMCPLTPKNAKVSPDGCAVDVDMDGVKDYQDKCLSTPLGYEVDNDGCAISANLGINFKHFSDEVDKNSMDNIQRFADFVLKNKEYQIKVIGHTSLKGSAELNMRLSQRRANAVKNKLVEMGVSKNRITSEGRGETQPIADEKTPEGKHLNRRVVVELSK